MTPPKLSVDQEQIYSALTDATGTSIRLKYPTSGSYLSSFIIEDLDGDGVNEAMVFYEKTGLTVEENTLRINILDRSDGKWSSVCDTPADGSEIEKVIISELGSNDRINLIIGSNLINRSEKTVSIYNYGDGTIKKNFSSSYSFIDVTDLDMDNQNEFLLLTAQASDSPAVAQAYKLDDNGKYHQYTRELSGSFTEFDSLVYGEIGDGKKGLYIDAVSGAGMIQTDIVYMDSGGLNKIFSTPEQSLSTVRPSGCNSFDIDSDGVPEIPVQDIFPGNEDVPESEQIKITNWMYIDRDRQLKQKYSSYYSVTDGYIFLIPENWKNKVTVRRDSVNDEIVFYEFDGKITGSELLRVFVATDSASREDRISNGYMLMHTKGGSAYLAYIPPFSQTGDSTLFLTPGDVAVRFKFKE